MRHLLLTAVLLIAGVSFAQDAQAKKPKAERRAPNMERILEKPEVIKEFDKDGDGKLSDAEKSVAKETMKKRHDEKRAEMIKKFDKDGDGKLNAEEQKAMREAMKAERKTKKAE